MHPFIDTLGRSFGVYRRVSLDLRRAAALVAICTLGLAACDKPMITTPASPSLRPSLDASSSASMFFTDPLAGPTSPNLTIPADKYSYSPAGLVRSGVSTPVTNTQSTYDRPMVSTVSGGYLAGSFTAQITVDLQANDIAFFGVGQGNDDVNFDDEPSNAFVFRIHNWFGTTIIQEDAVGQAQTPGASHFLTNGVQTNGSYSGPTTVQIAVDGDNVTLSVPAQNVSYTYSLSHYAGSMGLTASNTHVFFGNTGANSVFSNLSITPIARLFTSGSGVTAYDPLPGGTDANWRTDVCTTQPAVGPNDPRWANPHPAFVLTGHPWSDPTSPNFYFDAPWINAWGTITETPLPMLFPNAGFIPASSAPDYYSWSKYTTTVSGNGTFELDLLADNCSWVYLDDKLVGVQNSTNNPHAYGLTLNGTSTLTFLIFDGGGLAGGKFRLQTTDNPPPVLQIDNTPPVITPTVTGTKGLGDWYTSDVDVKWSVTDPESAISDQTGCTETKVTSNTAGTKFTCSATSSGGTTEKSVIVMRDDIQPTVTANAPTGTQATNGWFTTPVGVSWTISAAGPSGLTPTGCDATTLSTDNAGVTYTCSVASGAGLTASAQQTVKLDQTPPVVTFTGSTSYTVDQTVNITCSASDAMSGLFSNTCTNTVGDAYTFGLGAHTLSASATDKASNVGTGSATFTVSVTSGSLCALVERWVDQAGVANSMCQQLTNGAYGAFRNHVSAQSGKTVTAAHANILIALSNSL